MNHHKSRRPMVFISSTYEDLKPFRDAVANAALRAKFLVEMQEIFPAEGANKPLDECLKKVDE